MRCIERKEPRPNLLRFFRERKSFPIGGKREFRVNSTLLKERRIRVWLGDPPLDWSKPVSQADLSKALADRDRYPAEVLESEVFEKGKKALVLYGTFHFYFQGSLKDRIEALHPGAFFVVTPYRGFTELKCSEAYEKTVQNVATPVLVATPSYKTTCRRPDVTS